MKKKKNHEQSVKIYLHSSEIVDNHQSAYVKTRR